MCEAFIQFSIELYNWNPTPDTGSKVATESLENRLTYISIYKLVDSS